VRVGYAADPITGHVIVGIAVDDLTYSIANHELIVQRERGGRVEWDAGPRGRHAGPLAPDRRAARDRGE
jgi:hypothetical protein